MKTFALLDDEEDNLTSMNQAIVRSNLSSQYQAYYSKDPATIIKWVKERCVDAVVSDYYLDNSDADNNGLKVLKQVRQINENIPAILFSARIDTMSINNELKENKIEFFHRLEKAMLLNRIVTILKDNEQTVLDKPKQLSQYKSSKGKDIVLDNLKEIYLDNLIKAQDSNVIIPIPNEITGVVDRTISIKELIKEVEDLSELGCFFLKNWVAGKYKSENYNKQSKSFFRKFFFFY